MVNADRKAVTHKTVNIFDRIQMNRNKETNLLALACAFIIACKSLRIKEQDAFTAAKNLMVDPLRPEGISHAFAAMVSHLEEDYV